MIVTDLEEIISDAISAALEKTWAEGIDDRQTAAMLMEIATRVATGSIGPTRIEEIVRQTLAEPKPGIPSIPRWCRGVVEGGR
jgi:hypothetical protein